MSDSLIAESQSRMVQLCEQINEYKPKELRLNTFSIGLSIPSEEVRQQVATTALGDLLLPDGASLSIEGDDDYYPDLNLHVGDDPSMAVSLGVHKSGWSGFSEALYGLDLCFGHYSESSGIVQETVGLEVSTAFHHTTPFFYSKVWALAYAETGYEGHKNNVAYPSSEKVLGALALFEDLFAHELQRSKDLLSGN